MMAALGAEVVLVEQAPGSRARPGVGRRPRAGRAGGAADRRASAAPSAPTSSASPATSAPTTCTRRPRFSRQAGVPNRRLLRLRRTRAARSPAARRASRSTTPSIRCYVVEPEGAAVLAGRAAHRARATASRAAATRCPSCRCCGASTSTASCRSPTRRRSPSRAGWRARRGSSPGSPSGANVAAALRLLAGAAAGDGRRAAQRLGAEVPQSTDLWGRARPRKTTRGETSRDAGFAPRPGSSRARDRPFRTRRGTPARTGEAAARRARRPASPSRSPSCRRRPRSPLRS